MVYGTYDFYRTMPYLPAVCFVVLQGHGRHVGLHCPGAGQVGLRSAQNPYLGSQGTVCRRRSCAYALHYNHLAVCTKAWATWMA